MDLPASIKALGEQLAGFGEIAPEPDFLGGDDVFAAERERIFGRPWLAVDHETRLGGDRSYFRFDASSRSVLVTRDEGGRLHALRNVCIHAGYPVCDAEDGPDRRLICPYHGWEFALDGRLLEPNLSARIDPARLRLASYPVSIRGGLIFVDLSGAAPALGEDAAPAWLAEARVTRRARYGTTWNWKTALRFAKSSPQVFTDLPGDWSSFGPLSLMMAGPDRAALLRIIPRSAKTTDLQLIEIAAGGPTPGADDDRIAEGLRRAGDGEAASPFDRDFLDWYWSLMSEA
jgi:nitrite reductase/ring-hydroxylating ferredoxin subunit